MSDKTTVKSMNLSVQKPDVLLNFKVSAFFKEEIEAAAAACNMTVSAFCRIALEDKVKSLKK